MTENGFRRNPEWQALKGRENRYPNQFGGIGDNGDGTPRDVPVLFHRNGNGEAIIVPGVNMMADEVEQLKSRGAVFPLEIAQPCPSVPFETDAQVFGADRAPQNPQLRMVPEPALE